MLSSACNKLTGGQTRRHANTNGHIFKRFVTDVTKPISSQKSCDNLQTQRRQPISILHLRRIDRFRGGRGTDSLTN